MHVPQGRERLEGLLHVQGGGLEVDLDRRRAVVRQLERARHVVRHGVDLDDLDLVDALAAPPLDLVARHLVAVVVEGRRPRHGERRGRVRDADAGAARERLQLHRAAREAVRHGRRRRRDGGEGARAGGVHASDAHVVLGAALEARQRVAHPDARPRLVRVGHLPVELVVAQDLVVGRRGVVEDLVAARHVAVPAGARQARRRAARARERRGGRRVRGEVRRRRVLDDEGRHLGLAVGGPERQPPLHAQLVRGARHALDRRALGRVGRRVGLEVDRRRRVAVARRVAGGDADAEAVRDARVLEEVLDRVAVRRARLDVQGRGRRVVGREVAVLEEVRAAARRGRRAVADDGLQRGAPAEARADDGDGPDLAHEGVAGRARVRGEGDAVVHVVVLREGLLDGHVAHVVEELERPLDLERRRAHLAEVVVVEARVHGERPGVLVAAARVEVERRRRRRVARDAERLHLERADVARHVRPPLHLITRDRLAAVVLGRVPLDDELVPVAAREPHVRRRRRLDGHGGVGEGRVDHRRVGVVEEPRRRHEAVGLRRRRPQEPRDGAARRLAPLHRYVDERAGLEGLGGGAAELRVGNTAALVDLVLEGVEEQLAVDEEPRAVVHLRVEREDLVEGRAHEARPPHRDVVPARVRDRVLDLELEVDAVVDARRRRVAVEPAVVEVLAHEAALLRGRDVHEVRAHARRRVARVVEALAGVRHVRADGLGAAQPRHELRAEAPRHARDLLAGLVVRRLGARVVVRDDGRVRARQQVALGVHGLEHVADRRVEAHEPPVLARAEGAPSIHDRGRDDVVEVVLERRLERRRFNVRRQLPRRRPAERQRERAVHVVRAALEVAVGRLHGLVVLVRVVDALLQRPDLLVAVALAVRDLGPEFRAERRRDERRQVAQQRVERHDVAVGVPLALLAAALLVERHVGVARVGPRARERDRVGRLLGDGHDREDVRVRVGRPAVRRPGPGLEVRGVLVAQAPVGLVVAHAEPVARPERRPEVAARLDHVHAERRVRAAREVVRRARRRDGHGADLGQRLEQVLDVLDARAERDLDGLAEVREGEGVARVVHGRGRLGEDVDDLHLRAGPVGVHVAELVARLDDERRRPLEEARREAVLARDAGGVDGRAVRGGHRVRADVGREGREAVDRRDAAARDGARRVDRDGVRRCVRGGVGDVAPAQRRLVAEVRQVDLGAAAGAERDGPLVVVQARGAVGVVPRGGVAPARHVDLADRLELLEEALHLAGRRVDGDVPRLLALERQREVALGVDGAVVHAHDLHLAHELVVDPRPRAHGPRVRRLDDAERALDDLFGRDALVPVHPIAAAARLEHLELGHVADVVGEGHAVDVVRVVDLEAPQGRGVVHAQLVGALEDAPRHLDLAPAQPTDGRGHVLGRAVPRDLVRVPARDGEDDAAVLVVGVELRRRGGVPGDGLDLDGLLHRDRDGRRARGLRRELDGVLARAGVGHLSDDGRRRLQHARGVRAVPAALAVYCRVLGEREDAELGPRLRVEARVAPGVLGDDGEAGHLARRAAHEAPAVGRGPRRGRVVRLDDERERRAADGLFGDALHELRDDARGAVARQLRRVHDEQREVLALGRVDAQKLDAPRRAVLGQRLRDRARHVDERQVVGHARDERVLELLVRRVEGDVARRRRRHLPELVHGRELELEGAAEVPALADGRPQLLDLGGLLHAHVEVVRAAHVRVVRDRVARRVAARRAAVDAHGVHRAAAPDVRERNRRVLDVVGHLLDARRRVDGPGAVRVEVALLGHLDELRRQVLVPHVVRPVRRQADGEHVAALQRPERRRGDAREVVQPARVRVDRARAEELPGERRLRRALDHDGVGAVVLVRPALAGPVVDARDLHDEGVGARVEAVVAVGVRRRHHEVAGLEGHAARRARARRRRRRGRDLVRVDQDLGGAPRDVALVVEVRLGHDLRGAAPHPLQGQRRRARVLDEVDDDGVEAPGDDGRVPGAHVGHAAARAQRVRDDRPVEGHAAVLPRPRAQRQRAVRGRQHEALEAQGPVVRREAVPLDAIQGREAPEVEVDGALELRRVARRERLGRAPLGLVVGPAAPAVGAQGRAREVLLREVGRLEAAGVDERHGLHVRPGEARRDRRHHEPVRVRRALVPHRALHKLRVRVAAAAHEARAVHRHAERGRGLGQRPAQPVAEAVPGVDVEGREHAGRRPQVKLEGRLRARRRRRRDDQAGAQLRVDEVRGVRRARLDGRDLERERVVARHRRRVLELVDAVGAVLQRVHARDRLLDLDPDVGLVGELEGRPRVFIFGAEGDGHPGALADDLAFAADRVAAAVAARHREAVLDARQALERQLEVHEVRRGRHVRRRLPEARGLVEHRDREVAAPVALAAAAAEVARPVAAVGAADALRLGHVDAVGGHLLVRRGELDDLVADGPGDQVARRALDRLRHDDARRRLALVGRRGVEEPARVRRQERDVAERVGAEVPARHGAAPVEVDLPDAQPRRVGEDHARRLRVLVEALADARRRHRDVAERRQGL